MHHAHWTKYDYFSSGPSHPARPPARATGWKRPRGPKSTGGTPPPNSSPTNASSWSGGAQSQTSNSCLQKGSKWHRCSSYWTHRRRVAMGRPTTGTRMCTCCQTETSTSLPTPSPSSTTTRPTQSSGRSRCSPGGPATTRPAAPLSCCLWALWTRSSRSRCSFVEVRRPTRSPSPRAGKRSCRVNRRAGGCGWRTPHPSG